MQELEQLIQKFWANRTTKAENQRLLQLLEAYREMTAEAAPDKPFQEKDNEPLAILSPDRAANILQKIHGRLGIDETAGPLKETGERVKETAGPQKETPGPQKGNTAVVRKLYRRVAVAAAVGILALSTFLWIGGRHSTRPPVAVIRPDTPLLASVTNQHDSVMPLVLEDGSTVQLERSSSLSYYKPFINDRRDISLKGIATFKVAKDKKRPFTVYAGGIATTALGTRFLVNATDSRKVVVKLLEGKVVIKTAEGSNMTMNDVYLIPGQEFSFDRNSRQYVVNTIADHHRNIDAATPARPAVRSELVFQKEPLINVLENVGRLYKVQLSFRREDLHGLNFTGTFLSTDNLNIVLSTICNVNDLQFARNGDTIIITKSH